MMRHLSASVIALSLASCTTGQVGQPPQPIIADVTKTATLQFAVGTANIGAANGQQVTGLNVVATFRQPNGNNATGSNAPDLTGPPGINLNGLRCASIIPVDRPGNENEFSGISYAQLSALYQDESTLPTTQYRPFSPGVEEFGPYIGVFGYGFGAYNRVPPTALTGYGGVPPVSMTLPPCVLANYPFSNHTRISVGAATGTLGSGELALPIGSGQFPAGIVSGGSVLIPALNATNGMTARFPIASFGGPPAWPSPQGYDNPAYFDGFPEGFMDFGTTPVAGRYSLRVTFPTSADYKSTASVQQMAALPSVDFVLPALSSPSITENPDGSGFVRINVPTGLSEVIVNISTQDCDLAERQNGILNHFSIVTKRSGLQTLFLSSNLGPPDSAGNPTHTFCTAGDIVAANAVAAANSNPGFSSPFQDRVYVQAIGFDYPAYESSYPFSMSTKPPIASSRGTADITTSFPTFALYPIAFSAK